MKLTVRINGKEYRGNCVQGITFAEEYNETLDSGTIMLTHINKLINLRPYDDVLIYDSDYDEYTKYQAALAQGQTEADAKVTARTNFNTQLTFWRSGGTLWDGIVAGDPNSQPFYRHLLVDQFAENILNLSKDIYSYTIELMSETKGLEAVQLPNISITQPLNVKKKINIYTYLQRYIELYSPKIKQTVEISGQENTWQYVNKFTLDDSTYITNKFNPVYSPDFTLSNPTLRDVLSNLMIVCDCIPYVKDGVIYAKDISERTGSFDIGEEQAEQRINYISATMTSSDYCDSVRRQYSGALAKDGVCNYVENLGFRNKNNAIMTLENMQIETAHPIYKINKMYMCYYRKVSIDNDYYYFLCKQDITKLVKLDSEWNLLSQDWKGLGGISISSGFDEFSKYKLSTVSYSIGSNIISGWGNKYNVSITGITDVYDVQKTYIENIIKIADRSYPYGIYSAIQVKKMLGVTSQSAIVSPDISSQGSIYAPTELSGYTLYMKGVFFQVEYAGFYSGALIHSRDEGNDNIMHNDNSSSSLSLLEKDGLNQKEKLNRFANKTYLMKGRCFSMHDVLKLGQTTSLQTRCPGYDEGISPLPHPDETDTDVIIFRREYSILNNEIKVSYAGINDYVLKNYFTSVFAKYRTYKLMSYGESVERAENRKIILLLSKDTDIYDEETFYEESSLELLTAFKENTSRYEFDDTALTNINSGYFVVGEGENEGQYLADENTFTSGKSLCFNVSMLDNVSMGNYIKQWASEYQTLPKKYTFTNGSLTYNQDYVVGSIQDWYNAVEDNETGAIDSLGIYVCNALNTTRKGVSASTLTPLSNAYNWFAKLPKINKKTFIFSYTCAWTRGSSYIYLFLNYTEALKHAKRDSSGFLSMGLTKIDELVIELGEEEDEDYEKIDSLSYSTKIGTTYGLFLNNIDGSYGQFFTDIYLSNTRDLTNIPFNLYGFGINERRDYMQSGTGRVTNEAIEQWMTALGKNAGQKAVIVVLDDLYSEFFKYRYNTETETYGWIKIESDVYIGQDYEVGSAYPWEGNVYQTELSPNVSIRNKIGGIYNLYKDNKERINMTYQIEPISHNKNDIVFSEWFAKLNDHVNKYIKSNATGSTNIPVRQRKYKYDFVAFTKLYSGDDYLFTKLSSTLVDLVTGTEGVQYSTALPTVGTEYACDVSFNIKREGYVPIIGGLTYVILSYSANKMVRNQNGTITLKGSLYTEYKPTLGPVQTNIEIKNLTFTQNATTQEYVSEAIYNMSDFQSTSGVVNYGYIIDDIEYPLQHYRNMYAYYSRTAINSTYEYKEYSYDSGFGDILTGDSNPLRNESVESIFVASRASGVNKIRVMINNQTITQPGSIQFWYFNDGNAYEFNKQAESQSYTYVYSPEKSGYKFVFGVNITAADITRGYIDIYVSQVTNRDPKVYDLNHEVAGKVHNNAIGTPKQYNSYDTIATA